MRPRIIRSSRYRLLYRPLFRSRSISTRFWRWYRRYWVYGSVFLVIVGTVLLSVVVALAEWLRGLLYR
jgi:hypothetical protein